MPMMNERTTEMTYREELLCLYSDLYKDVYGVRPRGSIEQGWMANADEEAIKTELDWLSKQLEAVMDEEAQRQAENAVRAERRIAETIAMGAGDRENAIRWLREAEMAHDNDELCWCLGVKYGYFDQKVSA